MKLLPLILLGLLAAVATVHLTTEPDLVAGSLPVSHITYPDRDARGVIVLLSRGQGWSDREEGVADALADSGAVVVGVDLPEYYATLQDRTADCLYLVSDIEDLSRQLHRRAGIPSYHPPLVAGIGDGATLALAIAAQTPNSTIAGTIAVDPEAVIPLSTVLCTPAPKTPAAGGTMYGLTSGPLPNPVEIILTPAASPEGRAHAADLDRTHPALRIIEVSREADAVLLQSLSAAFRDLAAASTPLALPLVPLDAKPTRNLMAVIYSGDGGWRDIDQKLGGYLQKEGIPVVGIDALRYFWAGKTPQETADDLSRVIATYRKRWKVDHVVLIGYSFGANILPATYRALPEPDRQAVSLLSLLALSHQADFEIDVTGWLGMAGAGRHGDPVDDLKQIEPFKIQCIHGVAEDDSACPDVSEITGAQVLSRPGGHHFDGDYKALSDQIVERSRALSAPAM
jgi:type IV secretory pathway VirJ component